MTETFMDRYTDAFFTEIVTEIYTRFFKKIVPRLFDSKLFCVMLPSTAVRFFRYSFFVCSGNY